MPNFDTPLLIRYSLLQPCMVLISCNLSLTAALSVHAQSQGADASAESPNQTLETVDAVTAVELDEPASQRSTDRELDLNLDANLLPEYIITLTTGDVLTVGLVAENENSVLVDHPILGNLDLSQDVIQSLTPSAAAEPTTTNEPSTKNAAPSKPEPAAAKASKPKPESQPEPNAKATPEAIAQPKPTPKPKPNPDTPAAATAPNATPEINEPLEAPTIDLIDKFFKAWSKDWRNRFEIGFNGRDSNRDDLTIHAALRSQFKNKTDRFDINTRFRKRTRDGNTTDEEIFVEVTKDWLKPDSDWFQFVRGRYDYDRFEDWQQRLSFYGGFGQTLIKTKEFEANWRVGAGATKQFSGNRDFSPEGLLAAAVMKWNLTKDQTFTASTTYLPDLAESNEYRILNKAEWTLKLDHLDGVRFKLGVDHEFESDVAQNSEQNDTRYYGALVLNF